MYVCVDVWVLEEGRGVCPIVRGDSMRACCDEDMYLSGSP